MSVNVEICNIKDNPHCVHGPTVLFSRNINDKRKFFACSTCRDRKDCNFFIYEDELHTVSKHRKKIWELEKQKYLENINHIKLYITFNKIRTLPQSERIYCVTCKQFQLQKFKEKHTEHQLKTNISEYYLLRPSEFLEPLSNSRKEAQYLFSKNAVETIINILHERKVRNVLCIGTPRIHEYIINEEPNLNSLLLDIDKRYHDFYSPLKFCWFNLFNNYFFLPDSYNIFKDFLQTDSGNNFLLITDPPFGGRVELLSETFKQINALYQNLNKCSNDLEIMWIFPYFMEPQILNNLPHFNMLDYKVDYDNHSLFQSGSKGRKYGSPVRIFTNIDPGTVKLPSQHGYKYCVKCRRWVACENNHCDKCKACPSKDGRTYIHCDICNRCVKPTWKHCEICKRCAQIDHKCGEIIFELECFHCKQRGHKKRECPKVDHENLNRKRKMFEKNKKKKKMKL